MKESGNSASPQADCVKKKPYYTILSIQDSYDSLKKTTFISNRPQTSLEGNDKAYIVDKLVWNKRAPKETFYKICWYGYDLAIDTLDYKANIAWKFITSHWPSKTETKPDNSTRRERQIPNYQREEGTKKRCTTKRLKTKNTTKKQFIYSQKYGDNGPCRLRLRSTLRRKATMALQSVFTVFSMSLCCLSTGFLASQTKLHP